MFYLVLLYVENVLIIYGFKINNKIDNLQIQVIKWKHYDFSSLLFNFFICIVNMVLKRVKIYLIHKSYIEPCPISIITYYDNPTNPNVYQKT